MQWITPISSKSKGEARSILGRGGGRGRGGGGDARSCLHAMSPSQKKMSWSVAGKNSLRSQWGEAVLKDFDREAKVKRGTETIEEEEEDSEQPVLPEGKRSRQEKEAAEPEASLQKLGRVKRLTRQGPASKRSQPPSTRSTRYSKSIFKTPSLHTPAAHKRVFSVSANGSPLADSDIFITLPVSGEESLCMRASELSRENLLHLNPDTLGSMEKLFAEILHLYSRVQSHK